MEAIVKDLEILIDQIHDGTIDIGQAIASFNKSLSCNFGDAAADVGPSEEVKIGYSGESLSDDKEKSVAPKLSEAVESYLASKVAGLTGVIESEIEVDENFLDLGLSSSQIIQMTELIEEDLGIVLYPTLLFEYQDIQSLRKFLADEFGNKLMAHFGIAEMKTESKSKSSNKSKEEEKKIETKAPESMNIKLTPKNKQVENKNRDVAIIGIGGMFPGGSDLDELWDTIKYRRDAITEVREERWNWKEVKKHYSQEIRWGGFIKNIDKFDASFFGISPKEAEMMDPQHRILIETIWKTIEDAGYKTSDISGTNMGLFIGISSNDYSELMLEAGTPVEAFTSIGTTHSIAANRISYMFNLRGPSMAIDTACSSSLVALSEAIAAIRNGKCDAAIVGGVNALLTPKLFVSFTKAGMLSEDGRCKTFDKSANGYVRGEGVGAVLIKPLKKAKDDGDHIYAVIKGCAINHGGHTNSMTAPNPNAQAELIISALDDAELDMSTISYFEAHGTGTALGDPIEIEGLKKAYSKYATKDRQPSASKKTCAIGTIKTNIGHLESAAGIAGLIKVILLMKYKKITGIRNFKEINPYIDLTNTPFYISEETREWECIKGIEHGEIPRRAGLSSFGFGGANAHVVLEEYEERDNEHVTEKTELQLIPLSAKTEKQLQAYAKKLFEYINKHVCQAEEYNENSSRLDCNTGKKDTSDPELNISEKITGIASEIANVGSIEMGKDESFDNIGFTTKEYDDFINRINENFQINLTTRIFSFATTIDKVTDQIKQVLGIDRGDTGSNERKPEVAHISLEDIAYTLQIGRNEMNERLAIVAGSLEELSDLLMDYTNGEENRVYRDNAKNNKLGGVLAGKMGDNYLTSLMEAKEYGKLAQLWVSGAKVDWKKLKANQRQKKISLPTYPFDRKRYWLPDGNKKYQVSLDHPLLGRNVSTLKEQMFYSEFDGNEFFLKDHIVNQKKVLPGAAYLEMVRAAGELSGEGTISTICNASWIKPLIVSEESIGMNVSLYSEEDGIAYEVWSKDEQENETILFQCFLGHSEEKETQNQKEWLHVEEIKKRCPHYMGGNECYTLFHNMGLEYGEFFQTILELYAGDNESLSKLQLPVGLKEESEKMTLHPSLLDGAFQSVIGCIVAEDPGIAYVPCELGKLSLLDRIPEACYVYACLREKEKGGYSFDIKVLREDGLVVVSMDNFKVRVDISTVVKLQNKPKIIGENTAEKIADNGDDSMQKRLRKELIKVVSGLLKLQEHEIDLDEEMSLYGFDSITLTDFSNLLNDKYNVQMTPAIFYAHTSINAVTNYLCQEYKEELTGYFGISEKAKTSIVEISVESDGHGEQSEARNGDLTQKTRRQTPFRRRATGAAKWQPAKKGQKDIAVIGIGGVMPQSRDLLDYWENLTEGKNCITEIPSDRWDWKQWYGDSSSEENKTYIKWGGFMPDVDKFDPIFFGISPMEAELMDPQQRIFMETVWKTIEDSGYAPSELSGTDTGIFAGVSTSDYHERLVMQNMEIMAQTATGKAASILPNRISFMLNLTGPSEPVDTACSSALVAVHRAIRSIQSGDCSMAIAGGVNVLASPTLFISFDKAGMLSPDGCCKTFDEKANGYVRGEGAGAVLLKTLEQAEADGDYIYAVIKGSAVNHGGHANSMTAPNPNAQTKLLVKAYNEAGIPFDTVTYVETHGTGTPLGDPIEINALKQASRELSKNKGTTENKKRCGIGAVKTNIGHLESAAGIAGLLKVILSMKYGKIPGTLHFNNMNPYIDLNDSPFYIIDKTKDWEHLVDEGDQEIPRRAGVSSFGFGGSNAHVVLEEYKNK